MNKQNGITIADVLKMECMNESRLIAGSRGMKNIVSRVNIMADYDILNWVSPGELLLMTSYSMKLDDIEWLREFITECSRRELSGIGIKMYPNDSIPEEIIEFANNFNVAVLIINSVIPFSQSTADRS